MDQGCRPTQPKDMLRVRVGRQVLHADVYERVDQPQACTTMRSNDWLGPQWGRLALHQGPGHKETQTLVSGTHMYSLRCTASPVGCTPGKALIATLMAAPSHTWKYRYLRYRIPK